MQQDFMSTVPGTWITSTPIPAATGRPGHDGESRWTKAWTAVTAVELGVRPLMFGWPRGGTEDFLRAGRPLAGACDFRGRGRLGYFRQNALRPRLDKFGEPPELREKVYKGHFGDVTRVPHPRTAIKKHLPPGLPMHQALTETIYGTAHLRDNPFALLEEFIPPFSNHGLCMRWSGDSGGVACTLIFQKTCFDAKSADGADVRLAQEVDGLRERWLLGGPKPLLNLWGDPVETLLPGNMGWTGEFQLRSPESPGYDCERCDQKVGHCPTKLADLIQTFIAFKGEFNLDFLVNHGFSMDPQLTKRRAAGYELRVRMSAASPPTLEQHAELARWLKLQSCFEKSLVIDHQIGPGHHRRKALVAVGTPLGASTKDFVSPPLTAKQVVNCLAWPRRQ